MHLPCEFAETNENEERKTTTLYLAVIGIMTLILAAYVLAPFGDQTRIRKEFMEKYFVPVLLLLLSVPLVVPAYLWSIKRVAAKGQSISEPLLVGDCKKMGEKNIGRERFGRNTLEVVPTLEVLLIVLSSTLASVASDLMVYYAQAYSHDSSNLAAIYKFCIIFGAIGFGFFSDCYLSYVLTDIVRFNKRTK